MKEQTYLVLGGTGKTGGRVVEKLNKLGKQVKIGSRKATPSFDWNNTQNWAEVVDGVDAVYITFQPDLAIPGAQEAIMNFTEVAVNKGIKKLVLLSGKGEKEAEICEDIVKASGTQWTIVRASWFSQNFSESFFLDPILSGHVALPKPEAKVPYVDADDIADVVVEALLNDEHNGKTYQLTGPRQLTFEEVTNEIAKASGRDIKFTPISLDDYTAILKELGIPEDVVWLIDYLFTEVLVTSNSEITYDVEKVLGRAAKDFKVFARETAASGVWNPVEA